MVADRVVENPNSIRKADAAVTEKIYSMILRRNKYYRDNLRFLILVMLMGMLTLLFLVIAIFNLAIEQKKVYYIPAHLDGTVIKSENLQVPQLDGAPITDQQIIDWVQQAIPTVYNFNFLSPEGNFRNMVHLFTPEGYRAYKFALEEQSKTIATIKATLASVQGSGCGDDTVTILRKGVEPVQNFPVYTWHLKMPMVVRNSNKNISAVYKGKLVISVQRVPQMVSKSGIAIYSFVYSDTQKFDGDAEFAYLCEHLPGLKV